MTPVMIGAYTPSQGAECEPARRFLLWRQIAERGWCGIERRPQNESDSAAADALHMIPYTRHMQYLHRSFANEWHIALCAQRVYTSCATSARSAIIWRVNSESRRSAAQFGRLVASRS